MHDQVLVAELYNTAAAVQKATEEICDTFPPFEGLAASIQLKKAAKAAVAHIGEGKERYNVGDRIRLLRLAGESIDVVEKSLDLALKVGLVKQEECAKLKEAWGCVSGHNEAYIQYLETGGKMEAPL